jgi:hypothetical protein
VKNFISRLMPFRSFDTLTAFAVSGVRETPETGVDTGAVDNFAALTRSVF